MIRLTSLVSSISKNVRKYAEVGYQRLGTALPISLSDKELVHYTTLAAELCNQCQVCDIYDIS